MITAVSIVLNPITVSEGRQPRGVMRVNDKRLNAWIKFEVDNNIFYEADSFRVNLAISELPPEFSAYWWSEVEEVFVELFAGFPSDPDNYSEQDLDSLTYGRVDNISYDPIGRVMTLTGRDLTAELIDAKTTETFQNLTSSQIATLLAKRHNLIPVVTETKKLTGKYYQIDNARMNQQRSEWDLLTALAGEEQFNVFIKGRELHFAPQAAEGSESYSLKLEKPTDENGAYSFNGMGIVFERALTIARGVTVTVQSVSPKTGQPVKVTYPNKPATLKPGQSKPTAQQYTYTFANLTYEKALQKAQQLHSEISKHEVKLRGSMPADNLLSVENLIAVTGTETAYDQSYYPESVTREMSFEGGYVMSVNAKNHSPKSMVTI